MRLRLAGLGMVLCSVTEAAELASRAAPPAALISTTPLRTLSSTRAPIGDYFAWAGQALCDENGSSYFLVAKPITPGRSEVDPRAVLRISADGTKRFSFTPAAIPELARAQELQTVGFALNPDPDGGLFMLIWAATGGQGRQYILDFDKNGEYRSHIKVDPNEILVEQFEVFGSGKFLLRGRWRDRPEPRLAILSAPGGGLKEVVGWPGLDKPMEEPSLENQSNLRLDQITRGGDGRIYVAALDAREGEDVVYAFGSSGDSKEAFTLRPMPKAPRLLGWKAAGRRFAAAYQRDEPRPEAAPGEHRGRYWIAVYDNRAGGGDLQPTVYGPAPGPPICYRHEASRDRFTFLQDGKLVTMSAP
jgi:hypothetical protein